MTQRYVYQIMDSPTDSVATLQDLKKDTNVYSIAQFVQEQVVYGSEIRKAKVSLIYTLGNEAFSTVNGDIFEITDKNKHFENAFEKFKKLCTLGCDIRLSEFTEQGFINYFIREIGLVMNDSAGTWVFYNGMVIPFDRYLRAKPNGTKFYIGSIFIYEKDIEEILNV